MRSIINWKIFFVLLFASLCGILAIFPYILTLQKDLLTSLPIPLSVFIITQIIQSLILFSLALFFGLLFAKKIGFTTPLLHALVTRNNSQKEFKSIFKLSLLFGSIAGIVIMLLDYFFVSTEISLTMTSFDIPLWQRFLASFYGGINEEVLMRLFLMTLIVWITAKVLRVKDVLKNAVIIWFAILLTSLLFGLGHLPITATLTELTPLIVLRGLLLNGIGGVIFGWLYWKKGLEAAIIAHFTTDIYIQIIFPLLLGL